MEMYEWATGIFIGSLVFAGASYRMLSSFMSVAPRPVESAKSRSLSSNEATQRAVSFALRRATPCSGNLFVQRGCVKAALRTVTHWLPAMSFWIKQLYVDHDDYFTVSRERFGSRYYLDVLCGEIGVYERRIELNREEIDEFNRDPRALRVLALRLTQWPDRYKDRLLRG